MTNLFGLGLKQLFLDLVFISIDAGFGLNDIIMKKKLDIEIMQQPDDTTCGPTCLHAVYNYYGDKISLNRIISETKTLRYGGTLAVFLASHALKHGYTAKIYTYNLHIFDPTWFGKSSVNIIEKLKQQAIHKLNNSKLRAATEGYIEFLELGGKLEFNDLSANLIRRYLGKSIPILTGLSSTYLYRTMREFGQSCNDDDLRGEPSGHFVIISGYDKIKRK